MNQVDLAVFSLAVPMTIALVQLLKEAGLPSRYAGAAAVIVGIFSAHLVQLAHPDGAHLAATTLTGLIAGLAAAGVWSGTKALTV